MEDWTTIRALDWTAGRFERAGIESARLEAQVLLAHALGCNRVALYTSFDKPLAAEQLGRFRELIKRRLGGESVAYLVGEKEFWSRPFAVTADVLVPRADTETLIEAVLDRRASLPPGPIADVGTGSGIIAITLSLELARPAIAVDISEAALAVARRNADALGAEQVELRRGDLCAPLAGERLAVLASNPPYIPTAEIDGPNATIGPEVRCEPRLALDGGADGLGAIRRLVAAAADLVVPEGLLVFEHAEDQGAASRALVEATGAFAAAITARDLGDRDRVTLAERR
jgi:release factor glutamine methyltransferase